MINADYNLLSVTTDDGEKYAFQDKKKMFLFLREMIKDLRRDGKISFWGRPYIFKGVTK